VFQYSPSTPQIATHRHLGPSYVLELLRTCCSLEASNMLNQFSQLSTNKTSLLSPKPYIAWRTCSQTTHDMSAHFNQRHQPVSHLCRPYPYEGRLNPESRVWFPLLRGRLSPQLRHRTGCKGSELGNATGPRGTGIHQPTLISAHKGIGQTLSY
jgi:hypothetical protein